MAQRRRHGPRRSSDFAPGSTAAETTQFLYGSYETFPAATPMEGVPEAPTLDALIQSDIPRQARGTPDGAVAKIFHSMLWFLTLGLRVNRDDKKDFANGVFTVPAGQTELERFTNFRIAIHFIRWMRIAAKRWEPWKAGPPANIDMRATAPERIKTILFISMFKLARTRAPVVYRNEISAPGLFGNEHSMLDDPEPFLRELAFNPSIRVRSSTMMACFLNPLAAYNVWSRIEYVLNEKPVGLGGLAILKRLIPGNYGAKVQRLYLGRRRVPEIPTWLTKQVLQRQFGPAILRVRESAPHSHQSFVWANRRRVILIRPLVWSERAAHLTRSISTK